MNPIERRLTAWVDGELTPEERRAVEDLLRQHPGLEVMLARLKDDSARLKSLPRQALPANFSTEVLGEIRRRNIEIIRQRHRPLIVRYLMPAAAAAAILVALGMTVRHLVGVFGKDSGVVRAAPDGPRAIEANKVAAITDGPQPASPAGVRDAFAQMMAQVPSANDVKEHVAPYRALLVELGNAFREQSSQLVAALTVEEGDAESPFSTPTILTFPAAGKANPLKTIEVRLPLFLDVRSLDAGKLLDRLREDSVHHLDLPCVDSWKALDRFQTACRAAGVKLVLDAEAGRRLHGRNSAIYLIYLEDVAPETVARLMQALQAEDLAAEKQKKGEGQFQSLMVQSLDEDGQKRLAEALGVSPASLMPLRPAKSTVAQAPGIDTSKPISSETLKSLQKAAAGRPTGRPAVAQGEPTAVAVVWHSRLRTPLSKDVRALLDAKKPGQSDGINVVFLFRPSRG